MSQGLIEHNAILLLQPPSSDLESEGGSDDDEDASDEDSPAPASFPHTHPLRFSLTCSSDLESEGGSDDDEDASDEDEEDEGLSWEELEEEARRCD